MIVSQREISFKPQGFVGIDPGAHGAIAVWYGGRIAEVIDMPRHDVIVSGKKRNMLDYGMLSNILVTYVNLNYMFFVEMTPVFAIGGGSNSSANWALGYSQGFLTAYFMVHRAAFRFVRTQEWHKMYNYKDIDFRSVEAFKTPTQKTNERKRLIKHHSLCKASSIASHIELMKLGKTFKTGRETADKVLDGRCESILIANYGRLNGQ